MIFLHVALKWEILFEQMGPNGQAGYAPNDERTPQKQKNKSYPQAVVVMHCVSHNVVKKQIIQEHYIQDRVLIAFYPIKTKTVKLFLTGGRHSFPPGGFLYSFALNTDLKQHVRAPGYAI